MVVSDASRLEDFGGWPELLARLFRREDLSAHETAAALEEILEGRADPSCIAAFLSALRTKGETVEEMTGILGVLRAHGEVVSTDGDVIDTCGTGGDRSGTINVSTMAAIVANGAGARVCKHGGRASSSLSGSADVLEALGVAIELGPAGVQRCIETTGMGFCFAPRFHPAMRHVAAVRRAIGVGTVFNFVAPLANPARAVRQVVGVGDASMAEKLLGVLEATGAVHAMVFYGHDGLDELSTTTRSTIFTTRLRDDGSRERQLVELDPTTLGISPARPEELRGGDPEHNAERARLILAGEPGPQRDIVELNAAAALVVAGIAEDLATGLVIARSTIDSGEALRALAGLIDCSTKAAADELV